MERGDRREMVMNEETYKEVIGERKEKELLQKTRADPMGRGEKIKRRERQAFCVSKNFWRVSTVVQQLPPLVGQATPRPSYPQRSSFWF